MVKVKTGIIIQARKGSSRLPNKMVLPFYNDQGVLDIVLKKLKKTSPHFFIVLATTTNPLDDELVAIAKANNVECFRGSEENVLSRFIGVGKLYRLDNVVRICADNPFLDTEHIDKLISIAESDDLDYVSFKTKNGLPVIKSHLGLFTEVVKLDALIKIEELTREKIYLEHVTNFIYDNKLQFKIRLLKLPNYFDNTNNIRLTLDTKEDFILEKELYSDLKEQSTAHLIQYLKGKKDLIKRMAIQIENNSK